MEPDRDSRTRRWLPADRAAEVAAMAAAIAEDIASLADSHVAPGAALERQSQLLGDLAGELAYAMGAPSLVGEQDVATNQPPTPSDLLSHARQAHHASEHLARRVADLCVHDYSPSPYDAQLASALAIRLDRLTAQVALLLP